MKRLMKRVLKLNITVSAGLMMVFSGCGPSANVSSLKSTGSERLSWTSEPVTFDTSGGVGVGLDTVSASSLAVPLSMTQVATLASPIVNGSPLQANSVAIVLNKAYVAYNTQGVGYGGGVDVIDISTPASPSMTSTATYADRDFAGLARDGFDLYAAGADASGAKLYRYTLGLGGDLAAAPDVINLPGSVGLGVQIWPLRIYAVSGDNGGLSTFSRASILDPLVAPTYVPLADARDLSVATLGEVRVVTGKHGVTPAGLSRFDSSGNFMSTSASLGNPTDDEAKSTIKAGAYLDLVTAGEGGTKLICAGTNAIVQTIPIPTSATLAPSLLAANAATFGNGLIYVSNGAGGIYVYSVQQVDLLPSCNVSLQYVGRIVFEDGTSVNNVVYNAGQLIVAMGTGGFRVINVTQGFVLGLMGAL